MPPVESCIKKLQWCLGTAARVVHVHGGEAQPAPLPPPLPPPPVALTAMPPSIFPFFTDYEKMYLVQWFLHAGIFQDIYIDDEIYIYI
jgi:hypothetical protein